MDGEENEMKLIMEGKSTSLSKGYHRTVADAARGVEKKHSVVQLYTNMYKMKRLESLS